MSSTRRGIKTTIKMKVTTRRVDDRGSYDDNREDDADDDDGTGEDGDEDRRRRLSGLLSGEDDDDKGDDDDEDNGDELEGVWGRPALAEFDDEQSPWTTSSMYKQVTKKVWAETQTG